MKYLINLQSAFMCCALLVLSITTNAQSPQALSYQAVIRDASNNLLQNTAVGMQISILQGSAAGSAVYVETHAPTTNDNGLVSIEIGNGTPVSGVFGSINWANGPYFVKSETDPTGGTSYTITGTSQLLSVPYALYAGNALSVETYSARIPSNITSPPPGIVIDFSVIDLNTDPSIFEYLSNGEVLIKKTGTIHVDAECLFGTPNDASFSIHINGVEKSRSLQSGGAGNRHLKTSYAFPVQQGDQIEIIFNGSSSVSVIYGNLPWSKLNIQWIGIKN